MKRWKNGLLLTASVLLLTLPLCGCDMENLLDFSSFDFELPSFGGSTVDYLQYETRATEYIQQKYGITATIVESKLIKTAFGFLTGKPDRVHVQMLWGEKAFGVLVDTEPTSTEAGTEPFLHCADNLQAQDIEAYLRDYLNANLEGAVSVKVELENSHYSDYAEQPFTSGDVYTFLAGKNFSFYAYYVGHDFSDNRQVAFLSTFKENGCRFEYMLISCRSIEAVPWAREADLTTHLNAMNYAQYIESYRDGGCNGAGELAQHYEHYSIYAAGDFLCCPMSIAAGSIGMDSDNEPLQLEYSTVEMETPANILTPVFHLKTDRAVALRVFYPLALIPYQVNPYEWNPSISHDVKFQIYDLLGRPNGNEWIDISGQYAVCELVISGSDFQKIDEFCASFGIFKTNTAIQAEKYRM